MGSKVQPLDRSSSGRRSLSERRPGDSPPQHDVPSRMPSESRIITASTTSGGDETELRGMVDEDQDLCSLLIRLQDHHWRIHSADVEVLLRPDGSDFLIGEGAHAKVYQGILNQSVPVAIKCISDEKQYVKRRFVEEIVCVMNLRHANVLQFMGAVIEDDCMLLISEFMHRGSLFDAIAKDKTGQLSWYNRGRLIALDIVRGLTHMHCKGFVHQDLKSKNVLLAKDYTAKLADMGLFGQSPDRQGQMIRDEYLAIAGTVEWTAPEVLTGASMQISFKSDIYSLGITLGEIIKGEPPEGGGLHISCPEQAPREVADIVYRCLDDDAEARPTAQEVFDVLSEHHPPRTRPLRERKLSSAVSTKA